MSTWTVTVQEEGDDLVVPLPDELLVAVGWKPGDTVTWDVQQDGTIILKKKQRWFDKLKGLFK